ncbi:hypothetical protein MMC20_001593 [Loxospora ochrophaea]|nr:hypothetical protein [Loxospora ochrophaea]
MSATTHPPHAPDEIPGLSPAADSPSSFGNDSNPSQALLPEYSSKNASQIRLELSPPSSLSLGSSQEHPDPNSRSSLPPRSHHVPLSQVASEQATQSQVPRLGGQGLETKSPEQLDRYEGVSHGQKRTASGTVKSGGASQQTSPVDPVRQGHSRNTSTTSNGTQIGELSAQLRTRLSYAMLKVQNGWQSRTIDEVESLASQQTSPVSTVSPSRRIYDSPRINMLNHQRDRAGFAQSSERTTAAPSQRSTYAPQTNNGNPAYHSNTTSPTFSPSPNPPSRTYESFWAETSAGPSHSQPQTQTSPTRSGPFLGPPADIYPRNSHRSNPHHTQPLRLHTNDLSSHPKTFNTSLPSTPPSRGHNLSASMRTPSQKAAMEQDAIETLMFMSSPGNSGYHPPPPPSQTHTPSRRSQLGAADTAMSNSRTKRGGMLDGLDLGNEENIDRILDQMPAGSSSSSSSDDEGQATVGRHPGQVRPLS